MTKMKRIILIAVITIIVLATVVVSIILLADQSLKHSIRFSILDPMKK